MWLTPRMPAYCTAYHIISDSSATIAGAQVELRTLYGCGSCLTRQRNCCWAHHLPSLRARLRPGAQRATPKCLAQLLLVSVGWIEPTGPDETSPAACGDYARGEQVFRGFASPPADQGVAVGWQPPGANMVQEGELIKITDLELDAIGRIPTDVERQPAPVAGAERVSEWFGRFKPKSRTPEGRARARRVPLNAFAR